MQNDGVVLNTVLASNKSTGYLPSRTSTFIVAMPMVLWGQPAARAFGVQITRKKTERNNGMTPGT